MLKAKESTIKVKVYMGYMREGGVRLTSETGRSRV